MPEPKPDLTVDEIDDILYFVRTNSSAELDQIRNELAKKYGCSIHKIVDSARDPETGNTALHYAAANGFIELVSTQFGNLSPGMAAPNRSNKEGNTPLHWAAYNGHLEMVKFLVEHGANMWNKNNAGHLPMYEAERAEKNDVVQYLLEKGGNEVENTGEEGEPSAEDVAEVQAEAGSSAQNGDIEAGSSKQAAGGD